ncbi:MAG TPA: sugar transferase [Acidimicrobiales bacterium]|nr:sugar transferase [Acidimicrobiales bacterium]
MATDVTAGIVAALAAVWAHPGVPDQHGGPGGWAFSLLVVAGAGLWVGALAVSGSYGRRLLGTSSAQLRHVLDTALRLVAIVALLGFGIGAFPVKPVVLIAAPVASIVSAAVRCTGSRWLHSARRKGRCLQRLVVVGAPGPADDVIRHFHRTQFFQVVAVHSEQEPVSALLLASVRESQADAVMVIDPELLGPEGLRDLRWELEGTGVDLLVAPAAADVAGTRLRSWSVAGLPLIQVREPCFTGPAAWVKNGLDRLLAALGLIVALPLMTVIAATIKATSPGPVFFRQVRAGRGRVPFVLLKFRTMEADAEHRLPALVHLNEADGALFKLRSDPRVTPVGRVLRRLSLDELPQLWNVVTGHMSIVGPRPLVEEVQQHAPWVQRRLSVKPGLTGLWQVSGRTDLLWEEALRLDLQYVDNWSLAYDLAIVARTVTAVLRRQGAY